jgi:hypothetical protein
LISDVNAGTYQAWKSSPSVDDVKKPKARARFTRKRRQRAPAA